MLIEKCVFTELTFSGAANFPLKNLSFPYVFSVDGTEKVNSFFTLSQTWLEISFIIEILHNNASSNMFTFEKIF